MTSAGYRFPLRRGLSHVWVNGRCSRCFAKSDWPLALDACPMPPERPHIKQRADAARARARRNNPLRLAGSR